MKKINKIAKKTLTAIVALTFFNLSCGKPDITEAQYRKYQYHTKALYPEKFNENILTAEKSVEVEKGEDGVIIKFPIELLSYQRFPIKKKFGAWGGPQWEIKEPYDCLTFSFNNWKGEDRFLYYKIRSHRPWIYLPVEEMDIFMDKLLKSKNVQIRDYSQGIPSLVPNCPEIISQINFHRELYMDGNLVLSKKPGKPTILQNQ
tara:strand:- start:6030 stop:6638 length:609 start_codon:yes stop_codon:yes gene_type:complete